MSNFDRRYLLARAKRLITVALDLCRDLAVRGYPSALNRAGRIFGDGNPEDGLCYLEQGIEWSRKLSDGWLWFANLIEHAELCYHAWTHTHRREYLARVLSHEGQIREAMAGYDFPDLKGRWDLIQGHLQVNHWQETGDEVIKQLPSEVKAEWQTELRRAWSQQKSGTTMLLARLEELY